MKARLSYGPPVLLSAFVSGISAHHSAAIRSSGMTLKSKRRENPREQGLSFLYSKRN